jgi:hypothetical protein
VKREASKGGDEGLPSSHSTCKTEEFSSGNFEEILTAIDMVEVTAIACVGKHHIGMDVITNPLLAACRLSKRATLAAQATAARGNP